MNGITYGSRRYLNRRVLYSLAISVGWARTSGHTFVGCLNESSAHATSITSNILNYIQQGSLVSPTMSLYDTTKHTFGLICNLQL